MGKCTDKGNINANYIFMKESLEKICFVGKGVIRI